MRGNRAEVKYRLSEEEEEEVLDLENLMLQASRTQICKIADGAIGFSPFLTSEFCFYVTTRFTVLYMSLCIHVRMKKIFWLNS